MLFLIKLVSWSNVAGTMIHYCPFIQIDIFQTKTLAMIRRTLKANLSWS